MSLRFMVTSLEYLSCPAWHCRFGQSAGEGDSVRAVVVVAVALAPVVQQLGFEAHPIPGRKAARQVEPATGEELVEVERP